MCPLKALFTNKLTGSEVPHTFPMYISLNLLPCAADMPNKNINSLRASFAVHIREIERTLDVKRYSNTACLADTQMNMQYTNTSLCRCNWVTEFSWKRVLMIKIKTSPKSKQYFQLLILGRPPNLVKRRLITSTSNIVAPQLAFS